MSFFNLLKSEMKQKRCLFLKFVMRVSNLQHEYFSRSFLSLVLNGNFPDMRSPQAWKLIFPKHFRYYKYFLGKLHQNLIGHDQDKNVFILSGIKIHTINIWLLNSFGYFSSITRKEFWSNAVQSHSVDKVWSKKASVLWEWKVCDH